MKPFVILSPIGLCSREEVEIILRSFTDLYLGVTNKHRKKLHLLVVNPQEEHLDLLALYRTETNPKAIQITENNFLQFENASVIFLPRIRQKNIIPKALSQGIPILGFDELPLQQFLDNTCGMMVKSHSREHDISQFSGFLSMLYFDPEALLMLKKGAKRRFKTTFATQRELMSEEAVFSQVA